MYYLTFGDLASAFQNRRMTGQAKQDLARLTQELSSGRKSDVGVGTTGDYMPLVGLQRSISAINAYATNIAEADLFATTMQTALDVVQTHGDELSSALLTAGNSQNAAMIRATAADATNRFEAVISAFNAKIADRYAFAGTAVDQPALADAQVILADLTASVAGQTTAAGIEAVLDTWFDTVGGSFDTIAYTGATQTLAPIRIGEGENVNFRQRADDAEIRAVLKSFAAAALVDQGVLSGNITEQAALTRRSGEMILSAQSGLSVMRAAIGSSQARIASVSDMNAATLHALQMARSDIVSADPFRAASDLQATQTQLETIYAVTARLSRLSLTEYLR